MRRRRTSNRLIGKLLFGAFLWVARKILEPIPVLRTVFDVVAFAA